MFSLGALFLILRPSCTVSSPGKVIKTLDEQGAARLRLSALHYAEHYKNFLELEEFTFK